jgi:hypothetical protein
MHRCLFVFLLPAYANYCIVSNFLKLIFIFPAHGAHRKFKIKTETNKKNIEPRMVVFV